MTISRLRISTRRQGSRIESVPFKKLKRMAELRDRRWSLKNGWLILEAR